METICKIQKAYFYTYIIWKKFAKIYKNLEKNFKKSDFFFNIMDCHAALAISRTLCVLTDVLLRKSHDAVGNGATACGPLD